MDSPILQSPQGQGTFAIVVPQLASKLLVSVRGTEVVDGAITNMIAAQRPGGRGADVKVVFRNSGNVHVRAGGTLAIVDATGQQVGRVVLEPALVLPGTVREFRAAWTRPLVPGSYVARATVDYGGDTLVSGEIGFAVRP